MPACAGLGEQPPAHCGLSLIEMLIAKQTLITTPDEVGASSTLTAPYSVGTV